MSIRPISPLFIALMIAALISASIAHAQEVDNPVYQAWAKFKVGSSTTLTGTMNAGPMTIEAQLTQTLVERNDAEVVIEAVTVTTFAGQEHKGPPQRQTIRAKAPREDWKEIGDEDVQAAGQTFKCKVIESKRAVPSRGGQTTETVAKVWVSPKVPGGTVQMKFHGGAGPNQEITYLLKSFDAK